MNIDDGKPSLLERDVIAFDIMQRTNDFQGFSDLLFWNIKTRLMKRASISEIVNFTKIDAYTLTMIDDTRILYYSINQYEKILMSKI